MDLRNSANVDLKKIIEKECPDCIIIGDLWVNLDKLESYHKTNSSEFKQLAHEFLDDYLDKSHLKLSSP